MDGLAPVPGTYALLFFCRKSFQAHVGKLGRIHASPGYWIYVGSAFGPGGLQSRLGHHLKPSRRPRWHLDYIKSYMSPMGIWTTTDTVKREHDWAGLLADFSGATLPISGFGASDCSCRSHLIRLPHRPSFARFVKKIHNAIPGHGPVARVDLNTYPDHPL